MLVLRIGRIQGFCCFILTHPRFMGASLMGAEHVLLSAFLQEAAAVEVEVSEEVEVPAEVDLSGLSAMCRFFFKGLMLKTD